MNKFSEINIINNTKTCPYIKGNRDGIEDIGIILHCYYRETPMYNDCLATALYDMQPDGSQIVSTFQADMKVSNLNKEARRGYKIPILNPKPSIISRTCRQCMNYQII